MDETQYNGEFAETRESKEIEKAFEILLSFDGTTQRTDEICIQLCNYFCANFGNEGPLRHIPKEIKRTAAEIATDIEREKQHNEVAARAILNKVNTTINAPSTYQGLGFSVITDTAGSIAYAALDSWERYKHDTLAKKQAYTQLAKDVRNVNMIKPGKHMDRLAREIKCAFGIREEYENTKAFVKEHRDFYLDDKYDLGVELGNVNIYQLLRKICNNESMSLDVFRRDGIDYDKLRDEDYIWTYGYPDMTICTTGKYEKWAMEQVYDIEHPEVVTKRNMQQEEQNKELLQAAKTALENKEYFRAATLFGQLADDEALRTSARIWHEHLMDIPMHVGDWVVSTEGKPIELNMWTKPHPITTQPGVPVKQLLQMEDCCISLQLDGHVWFSPNRLPKAVRKWSQVVELYAEGNHLFAIHQDGSVSCESISQYQGAYLVDKLTNVKKLQKVQHTMIALKRDGKIMIEGPSREDLAVCCQWENIKDIDFSYGVLVAITESGQLMFAGRVEPYHKVAEQWQNVIQVKLLSDSVIGITKDGQLLQSGEHLEGVRSQYGFVRIEHAYSTYDWSAVFVDGTIVPDGTPVMKNGIPDYSVVGVIVDSSIVTIHADGSLVKKGTIVDQCFCDIHTIRAERKNALEKLLAQKQAVLKNTTIFALGKQKDIKNDISFLQKEIDKLSG